MAPCVTCCGQTPRVSQVDIAPQTIGQVYAATQSIGLTLRASQVDIR